MFPNFSLEIHSSSNGYQISYADDTLSNDTLTKGLLGLSTSNDMSLDSPAFSVMLAGDYRWDYVVNENDIIIIRADPNMGVGSANIGTVNNNVIFVGMVSEIDIIGEFENNNLYYQITGQSLSKVFSQYKLGLIEEAQVNLSNMGWLWDTNADYEAESSSSSDGDDGSTNTSSSTSGKKITVNVDTNAGPGKPIARAIDKAVTKAIGLKSGYVFAQIMAESGGIDQAGAPAYSHKNLTGMHVGPSYAYSSWSAYASDYATTLYNDGVQNATSIPQFAQILKAHNYFGDNLAHYTKNLETGYAEYNGGDSSSDDSSSSSGSSDSSGSISGNVDASSSSIESEKENSTGVAFMGNDVATIENEIIERFKPYINYSYDNGSKTIFDFLDTSNFQSWDVDEKLTDSTQYTSFSGSLLELMDDIRVEPFNELYFEFESTGLCHVNVRRTPFDPDDWNSLETIEIDSGSIKNVTVNQSNAQAYSVFNVNPDSYSLFSITNNSGAIGSYPQYNQTLVDQYGYSYLEKTNQYLSMGDTESGSNSDYSKGDTDSAEHGTAYTYASTVAFLNAIDRNLLRINKATYAQNLTNSANNISAQEAVNLINDYINNDFQLPTTKWNDDMHISQGGGYANTGTKALNVSNVKKVISDSKGDIVDYMKLAKSTLKNVDDNELLAIWDQYHNGGNKLSKKDLESIVKGSTTKTTNASTIDSSASSLKKFTQRLFNWYADNPNFYSGDIVVVGHPDYRVGDRVTVYLNNYNDTFEFYIESVSHSFSFQSGWETTLGVTRGLPQSGQYRFNNLWGQSSDFQGGLMGEATFSNMAWSVDESSSSSSDSSSSDGSTKSGTAAAQAAVSKITSYYNKNGQGSIRYVIGAGRGSQDIFSTTGASADCSSTMCWLYKDIGDPLTGSTIGNTNSMWSSSVLSHVSGSNKSDVWKNLKEGDLVFWNTSGTRGHVGIYIGNNMCIANNQSTGLSKFDATTSYWWGKFSGDVARPK